MNSASAASRCCCAAAMVHLAQLHAKRAVRPPLAGAEGQNQRSSLRLGQLQKSSHQHHVLHGELSIPTCAEELHFYGVHRVIAQGKLRTS